MRNISDFKNEDAIDLIADLIEPVSRILQDEGIRKDITIKEKQMGAIKRALKSHKADILEIMARLEGVEIKDLNCTPISLIAKCIQILNDKEMMDFLSSLAENEQ